MQLTRPAVLSDDTERYNFGGGWISTRAVVGSDAEVQNNKAAIKGFVTTKGFDWQPDKGSDERTREQIHLVADVRLPPLSSCCGATATFLLMMQVPSPCLRTA